MSEAPAPRVLTVGHSTHPIDEFLALLRGAGVADVVDIRTIAGSRHNPQFGEDALAASLTEAGLGYRREARLGGLRGRTRAVDPEVNALWRNASFHRYADHALGAEFAAGLDALVELADSAAPVEPPRLPAIMCSEAVWWRCHRRIVADYLLVGGTPVAHLMPDGRIQLASLTPGAVPQPDGRILYPAE